MKLYELSTQYAQVVDMLDSTEADSVELLQDTLDSIQDAIEVKADGIARILSQIALEKQAIDVEIERLSDRSNRLKKQYEQLKKYLLSNLETADMKKLKTNFFTFSIRSSESVEIIDYNQIPKEYLVTKTETLPNKMLIKEAIKNKQIVAGCAIKSNTSLVIK